jgi:hypothetical protein
MADSVKNAPARFVCFRTRRPGHRSANHQAQVFAGLFRGTANIRRIFASSVRLSCLQFGTDYFHVVRGFYADLHLTTAHFQDCNDDLMADDQLFPGLRDSTSMAFPPGSNLCAENMIAKFIPHEKFSGTEYASPLLASTCEFDFLFPQNVDHCHCCRRKGCWFPNLAQDCALPALYWLPE